MGLGANMRVCPRCGELPTAWQEYLTGPWHIECPNCIPPFSSKTRELAIEEWDDQPYVNDLIRKIMILEAELTRIMEGAL